MLVYGFTGSQKVSRRQRSFIEHTLREALEAPDLVVTGGCIGADAIVGRWYAENRGEETLQHVILPYNLSKVDLWFKDYPWVSWQRLPAGTSYMDRNDSLASFLARGAAAGDDVHTVAFPRQAEEIKRSGTWATVRRYRASGFEPELFPLSAAP